MHRRHGLIPLVLALALGAGCDQKRPSEFADQLGQNITPGNAQPIHHLVWSADGSEVFFISGNVSLAQTSIQAARTDGSGVRVVDTAHTFIGALWGPPDGSALYFDDMSRNGPTGQIFEVFQAQKVADVNTGVAT